MVSGGEGDIKNEAFTPITRHFFKIIIPQILSDNKLVLPRKFVRIYGNDFEDSVLLRVPSGNEWRVELSRSDGNVCFGNGWVEFMKHHSVALGHLLVFEYIKNCCFNVILFDTSATEIEYPINGSPELYTDESSKDDEVKKANDVVLAITMNGVNSSFPRKRKRNAVASNSARLLKGQASASVDRSEFGGMKPKTRQRTFAGNKKKSSKETKLDKATKRISKLNKEEKDRALERAKASFKSNNPYFMVVMQPSYVYSQPMIIPFKFMERYFEQKDGNVVLQGLGRATWTVNFSIQYVKKKAKFKSNWSAFSQDNNVKVGDVCIFELINGTECAFKVTISRANREETHNSVAVVRRSERYDMEPQICLKDKSQPSKANRPSCSISHGDVSAANSYSSRNPFFKAVIQQWNLTKCWVNVPAIFLNNHIKESKENQEEKDSVSISLQLAGNLWPARLLFNSNSGNRKCGSGSISAGWRKFAKDNSLEAEDVCIFELIQTDPLILNVLIFKHVS